MIKYCKADQFTVSLFCFAVVLFFVSCGAPSEGERLQPEIQVIDNEVKKQFREGDLVLRAGTDLISSVFRRLNKNGSLFTHCGLLYIDNGAYYVCHIIADSTTRTQELRMDKLTDFIQPSECSSFAVLRLQVPPVKPVSAILDSFQRSAIRFDTHFDLDTDDKMYCSEFVYKVWRAAGLRASFVSIDTSHHWAKPYISIEGLFLNDSCEMIYEKQIK